MTPVQGFTYGETTYALLFHLEMTGQQITEMATLFPEDIRRGGLEAESLLAETPARVATLRNTAGELFSRWAALL